MQRGPDPEQRVDSEHAAALPLDAIGPSGSPSPRGHRAGSRSCIVPSKSAAVGTATAKREIATTHSDQRSRNPSATEPATKTARGQPRQPSEHAHELESVGPSAASKPRRSRCSGRTRRRPAGPCTSAKPSGRRHRSGSRLPGSRRARASATSPRRAGERDKADQAAHVAAARRTTPRGPRRAARATSTTRSATATMSTERAVSALPGRPGSTLTSEAQQTVLSSPGLFQRSHHRLDLVLSRCCCCSDRRRHRGSRRVLFLVLIVAALLALIGFFTRTA